METKRVASMVWHWTMHSPKGELPEDAEGWQAFLKKKHGETFPVETIDAAVVQCFEWLGKVKI